MDIHQTATLKKSCKRKFSETKIDGPNLHFFVAVCEAFKFMEKNCPWNGGLASHLSQLLMNSHMNRVILTTEPNTISLSSDFCAYLYEKPFEFLYHEVSQTNSQDIKRGSTSHRQ